MKGSRRKKIAMRRIFLQCATAGDVRYSDEGVRQWAAYDDRGIYPDSPHPHFIALLSGKRWANYTRTELKRAYFGESELTWPGTYELERQWGAEQLAFFLSWHPKYGP